ncbi:MAG: family 10 glycosylhydrolase [Candidatus Sumerlaeaceae bacterium]|nr:family 10 glycosylhydrolase [Candidatus Sumerlaeaceae bacterium]
MRPSLLPLTLAAAIFAVSALAQGDSPSAPAEVRGVWLDKAEILEGREKLTARLDRLSSAGFTAVYVATQVRGFVTYAGSAILPQWKEQADADAEIMPWLVKAIHDRGMLAQAWPEYGFYAYWTRDAASDPSRGPILDKHPQLTARMADGQDYLKQEKIGHFYSLCPSNPKSHELLAALYLEMLEKFPFDGLNLDRVRYPDNRYCFCDYCRTAFLKDTGTTLAVFDKGTTEAAALDRWRKERTREFVKLISGSVRARFPGRLVTACVVSPELIDEKGQDWPSWVRAGYVDAIMPMIYGTNIRPALDFLHKTFPDGGPVQPGLSAETGWETFSAQVRQVREAGWPGLTVWWAGSVDRLLPQIGAELFRP